MIEPTVLYFKIVETCKSYVKQTINEAHDIIVTHIELKENEITAELVYKTFSKHSYLTATVTLDVGLNITESDLGG